MCGIGGIAYAAADDVPPVGQLTAMAWAMAHRGPDDQGLYRQRGIGLCFRRLSIIDRHGGHQPIGNEDGSIWIVCNGEIYNHHQLRQELRERGHVFRSSSDVEVILHLYEEKGLDCLGLLRGMFAFALWDQRKHWLLLARDRLGIKPLYYTVLPGKICFASEIKPLLVLPGVKADVNLEAIDSYLTFRFVPAPLTLFQGIVKLQPGHYLIYSQGKVRVKRYWDLPLPATSTWNEDASAAYLLALLQETVRSHLQAETPVGLFLSGGLDSSILLALAAGEAPVRLQTFSLGFTRGDRPHHGFWELAEARRMARYYATQHHEIEVSPHDIPGVLADIIWQLEEPLGDPTIIPLYFISREAASDVKVVLSGEGADEIFAGYEVYLQPWQRTLFRLLPLPLKKNLLASLAVRWPADLPGKNFLRRATLPVEAWYRGVGLTFNESERANLYGPGLQQALRRLDTEGAARAYFPSGDYLSPLEKMLYFDIKYWLADDTLLKADKLTMTWSLELRVPFLDHRMVEYAAVLPPDFKIRGKVLKYILKKAVTGILPAEVTRRQKLGFTAPITSWVNNELHAFAAAVLQSQQFRGRDYFRSEIVEELLKDTRPHPTRGRQIFTLLVLELWHRLFIDGERHLSAPHVAMGEGI